MSDEQSARDGSAKWERRERKSRSGCPSMGARLEAVMNAIRKRAQDAARRLKG